MRFASLSWVQAAFGRRRGNQRRDRWARDTLAPQLRVTRLEERRVLNAQAAPIQQLVVDAGAASGDGHADTFLVEQHADHLQVSVNGREVTSGLIGQNSSILVKGSLDNDILIADFKSGPPPAGFNLEFDGGNGGKDSLTLLSGSSVDSVTHQFGAAGANQIEINSSNGSATISYRGVETVDDRLVASDRGFRFEAGDKAIAIGDAGRADDGLSRIAVQDSADLGRSLAVTFQAPTKGLSVETNGSVNSPDAVTISGLDRTFNANLRIIGAADDTLAIRGPTDVGSGGIDFASGTIRVENSLTTTSANVTFVARHQVTIEQPGVVRDDGGSVVVEAPNIGHYGLVVAQGGEVRLDSGIGGTTVVDGTIDVSEPTAGQIGGTVNVVGATVDLSNSARIDASGASGGGIILVGGGFHGGNPSIQNAKQTFVGPDAKISADALTNGDGGRVAVWADETTYFLGQITARGAGQDGGGGFVETSAQLYLESLGSVVASATNGTAGKWLIDPTDITISSTDLTTLGIERAGNVPAPGTDTFRDNGGNLNSATINRDDIVMALESGTSVVITTNSGGAAPNGGRITVAANIQPLLTKSPGATVVTLTLAANKDIVINNGVTIDVAAADPGDSLSLVLQAGGDVTDDGTIDLSAGAGGAVKIVAAGDITLRSTIDAASLTIVSTSGDFNHDGTVDSADLTLWKNTFGSTTDLRADGNGDGVIDAADYTVWRDTLGDAGTPQVLIQDNVTTTGALGINITARQIALNRNPASTIIPLELTAKGVGPLRLNGATNADGQSVELTSDTIAFTGGDGSVSGNGGMLVLEPNTTATLINVGFPSAGTAGELDITDQVLNALKDGFLGITIGRPDGTQTIDVGNASNLSFKDPITIQSPNAGGTINVIRQLDTLAGSGDINLDVGGALNINAPVIAKAGNITLTGNKVTIAGNVTADGAQVVLNSTATGATEATGATIKANDLLLMGTGPFLLNQPNQVGTLAADITGLLTFNDKVDLAVDDVKLGPTTIPGIVSKGNDVTLTVRDVTTTNLSINKPINEANTAGAKGNLFLDVSGNVTQASAGPITALGVALNVGGDTTLGADNRVATLAANVTGALTFNDKDPLAIDNVAIGAVPPGITSNGKDVQLMVRDTTPNALMINQPINEATSAGAKGNLSLDVSGSVKQIAAGPITAAGVALIVGGDTTLGADNHVAMLAAKTTGTLTFNDKDNLTIDDLQIGATPIPGIQTADHDVTLTGDKDVMLKSVTDAGIANVTMTFVQGSILDAGDSDTTADVDIVAQAAALSAKSAIGTITNFAGADLGGENPNRAGDAIEIMVSSITLAKTTATNSTIHLIEVGKLTVVPTSIDIAGNANGQAIIQATDDLNAGAGPIDLTGGDDLALLTPKLLTIPEAGYATTGNLRIVGESTDINKNAFGDVVAPGGILNFVAGDLFLRSGGQMDSDTLTTAIGTLTAQLDKHDLIVNELDGITLAKVVAESGDFTLNAGGAINGQSHDGVADVQANVIHLTTSQGGIGKMASPSDTMAAPLEVTAASALDADTTAHNSDIFIDSVGNLPARAVNAGTGNVTLGSSGNISNTTIPDGIAHVSGGTLDLTAKSGGIGSELMPLEVTAGTKLIAKTTDEKSNLFINSLGDLPVGLVMAKKGNVTLVSSGNINNITAPDNVAHVAAEIVDLKAMSGGIGTSSMPLEVAAGNQLGADTSAGNTTSKFDVFIDGIGGLPLGLVNAAAGNATLVSTASVTNTLPANSANVVAADLHLTSASGVGVKDNSLTTKVANLDGAGGMGGFFLANQNDLNVVGTGVSALEDVSVSTTAGDLHVTAPPVMSTGSDAVIKSVKGSVTLNSANNLSIDANISAVAGKILTNVGRNDVSALTVASAAELIASGGQISGQSLTRDPISGSFNALQTSDNLGHPIIGAKGTGKIEVIVIDSHGTNFAITIDWREGTPPPSQVTDRFVRALIDGSPPPLADSARIFEHLFQSPPVITVGGFVPVLVNISGFANNSIQLDINGKDLLFLNQDGSGGIQKTILVPVTSVLGLVGALPAPEPLPVIVAPPVVVGTIEVVPPQVQRPAPMVFDVSSGIAPQQEVRYYELRIVSFDASGGSIEGREGRIDLNDERLKAIQPFNLSKLPELFGRLPADRYRIYLIEEGTERLVLDFIIQQGRPIEALEVNAGDMNLQPSATGPSDNDSVQPQHLNDQPIDPASEEIKAIPPVSTPGSGAQPDAPDASQSTIYEVPRTMHFAERFGQAPFFSHGGTMITAAAVTSIASARREKSTDRLMERFGRCSRLALFKSAARQRSNAREASTPFRKQLPR